MLNVFVFEEEPALRDTLAAFLTDEECRVVTPADISEAADAVVLERFDLMLCDYWMGETDGLSFFHVIRDRQRPSRC
jgi:DNA-binding response OmpR family regulator